jgi:hypothetical protein
MGKFLPIGIQSYIALLVQYKSLYTQNDGRGTLKFKVYYVKPKSYVLEEDMVLMKLSLCIFFVNKTPSVSHEVLQKMPNILGL